MNQEELDKLNAECGYSLGFRTPGGREIRETRPSEEDMISRPQQVEYLLEKIRTLLEENRRLKDHNALLRKLVR